MTRRRRLVAAALFVATTATVVVGCCTPQLVMTAMTPRGDFDPALVPPAPDYARDAAWLALPTVDDEADVALPALPAVDQATAPVDVFFLHSTSSIEARWNAPFDEPAVRTASIRGGTLIQASVFNAAAPSTRPRTGRRPAPRSARRRGPAPRPSTSRSQTCAPPSTRSCCARSARPARRAPS